MKKWTEQMDEVLRKEYAYRLNVDLAKELGVSVSLVHLKARRLGLRKATDFMQVNRKVIYAKRRIVYHAGQFRKGTQAGSDHWYTAGHTETPEMRERRLKNAAAARRRQTYDELLRIKYGLRRRTRLPLPKEVYNIDRKKYIDDEK